jgi:hypothetical protein
VKAITSTLEEPGRLGGDASPRQHNLLVQLSGFRARVTSDCPEALHTIGLLYPPSRRLQAGRIRPHRAFSILRRVGSDAKYQVRDSGRIVGDYSSLNQAVAVVEHSIAVGAAYRLGHNLLVHAGSVAWGAAAVVFPGASGLGKSTLTAALCLSGFEYLSDELSVIDADRRRALPFPKALRLKDGGWRIVSDYYDLPAPVFRFAGPNRETVRYFRAPQPYLARENPRVRFIILLNRTFADQTGLAPVSRATAIAEMALHSLNLRRFGQGGIESLVRLVEGASCYQLTYGPLPDAVRAVSSLFSAP